MKEIIWSSSSSTSSELNKDISKSNNQFKKQYEYSSEINRNLIIILGSDYEFATLRVDSVVNRTNEMMTDWRGLSGALRSIAGQDLEDECRVLVKNSGKCHTGQCKVTRGSCLNARWVFHTVTPKFTDEFADAAEHALHGSWRCALSLAKEKEARSLVVPCLYPRRKGFPQQRASHCVARTLRCFLEHFPNVFERVILFFQNDPIDTEHFRIMIEDVLPIYFPRSELEAKQVGLSYFPPQNEWGEIIKEERGIKIKSDFATAQQSLSEPNSPSGNSTTTTHAEYEQVIFGTDSMVDNVLYSKLLEQAKEENFKDLIALNILYQGGTDTRGRPIIVFVAANMNMQRLDLDRVFRFMIFQCDSLVSSSKGYILVYLDNDISIDNFPGLPWVKRMYEEVLGRKYKKHIKAMYVVHPSWKTKAIFLGLRLLVSSKFWDKHIYVDTLEELYAYVPANRLLLPKIAYTNDRAAQEDFLTSWFG